MIDFNVYASDADVILHLPTHVKEIGTEWLENVTKNVNIADHHTLVGLVYTEKLSSVVLAKQQKKNITASVSPIFIRAGKTDSEFINSISIKDKLIIPNSQLSLAHHCVISENSLSFESILNVIDLDTKNTYQRVLQEYPKAVVTFIDFKIVPNCDIIANYTNIPISIENPYVDIIPNTRGEA